MRVADLPGAPWPLPDTYEGRESTPDELAEWVASDVYGAAMGLRSAHDGSGDPWPDEKTEAVIAALEARLAAWKPSPWPSRRAGDAGLRAFVQGCVDEVKARRAGTFGEPEPTPAPTTPTEAGPTSRLPHALADYRNAPSGLGPLAAEWKDKPHRLVYALAAEVTRLRIEAGCCGVCGRPPMRCVCPLTCPADCDCRGFA